MTWAAAALPSLIAIAAAALISHFTARATSAVQRQSAASEAREKHYETDQSTLLGFNQQLIADRQALLKRLDAIQEQVTNKHTTNLRADLTEVLERIAELGGSFRLLRGEVRDVRSDVNTLERRVSDIQPRGSSS